MITARKARNIVKKHLEENGVPFSRLKARTVSFVDLARDAKVFVDIWDVDVEHHEGIRKLGEEHGFIAKPRVPGAIAD